MNVLETKDMFVYNKEIYDFFKQLKIEDIQKLYVEPDSSPSFFSLYSAQNGDWVENIWEQVAKYFNLRIRLLSINETTPWKWNTEFTY